MGRQLSASGLALAVVSVGPAAAQAPLGDYFGQSASEAFGSSVVGLGDVDGDGIGDLAVGARSADGVEVGAGAVRIFSGFDGHLIRQIKGERTGDSFGHALDVIGDLDADGVADFIVGAPDHDSPGGTDRGAVYVLSGATGAQLKKVVGGADGDRLGFAVSGVPDLTGDGRPDYMFSAPWADSGTADHGMVYVYNGQGYPAPFWLYGGGAAGDHFGYSLDGVPDTTGDGLGDLLIGSPQKDAGGVFDAGQVSRKSGGTGAGFLPISGTVVAGWLGHTVVGLPDVNGDGEREIAVGEPFVTVGGVAGSGRIWVYSGANLSVLFTLSGADHDSYGWVVGAVDDFDGDGKGDLLVGVPWADFGGWTDVGAMRVFSGANGALLAETRGFHGGENFGASVGDAGDINGDGFSDAIAGATKYSLVAANAGRARVLLGNAPAPTNYCTAKTNSAGCVPSIAVSGCASTTVGQLTITATNVLPNISGIMFWSRSSATVPFYGGTLCVGTPRRRTPVQTSVVNGAGSACTGLYSYYFSHAEMQLESLLPGNQLFAQYWTRDPGFAPPNNVGLTDGALVPILP